MIRKPDKALAWQSKTILLLVVPWTVASVILQAHWWATQAPVVAWTTLGISGIFGLIVWWMKAGTPAAAATGAAITASLMFSTTRYSYQTSWLHGGLLPLLTVFLLTFAATKIGRAKKERFGTGESKRGRNAAQVAANLGVASIVASAVQTAMPELQLLGWMLAISVLAEAAADTVSSEIGQVFGGAPRMLTTMRRAEVGEDGGVTVAGTTAGTLAAAIVAATGVLAMYNELHAVRLYKTEILVFITSCTVAGVLGLLFDSLLGATLERRSVLNNDAVNFLSTCFAAVSALAIIWCLSHTIFNGF